MVDHLDPVDVVFGSDGVFAAEFKNYEPREGQVSAAQLCHKVMRDGGVALIEAPCGIGKSFAYGSMAAHAAASGKKICIVTANIALTEQLVQKDLPFLQRVLPWEFTFAMLKGRSNYACLDRRDTLAAQRSQLSLEKQTELDQLLEWFDATTTGDKSELPFIPVEHLWSKASVDTDRCKGSRCSTHEECFANRARLAAQNASIVVTNYHLFFAHLALMSSTRSAIVLPKFDVVVFDEAHEASDIARDFFGFTLTERQIRSILDHLDDPDVMRPIAEASSDLFERIESWAKAKPFDGPSRPEQIRIAERDFVGTKSMFDALGKALASIKMRATSAQKEEKASLAIADRMIRKAWDKLDLIVHTQSPEMVYWAELPKQNIKNSSLKLRAQQIVPGPVIAPWLFESQMSDKDECLTPTSVVIMSATMTTGGNFSFIRNELGVPNSPLVHEMIVDSPFDFAAQSMFVVPEEMTVGPRDDGYQDQLASVTRRTIDACHGRTLAIFTSYRDLEFVYSELAGRIPYRLMKQGDAPRMILTEEFKADVNSVLLGTSSFWTGIDVPGESLSGLVVSKTPFENPDTPLLRAIQDLTGDSFGRYSVPKAIMRLKQGVGRLIRSKTDRGVVVFCDRRVLSSRWGSTFLKSLPPMKRAKSMADVMRFMTVDR